jgi:hypothetical protein
MSLAVLNPQEELAHDGVVLANNQHRRQIIKKKVMAIGKMSKHFTVLREYPHLISELKQLNGGKLPLGVLAQGEQGLVNGKKKKNVGRGFKYRSYKCMNSHLLSF